MSIPAGYRPDADPPPLTCRFRRPHAAAPRLRGLPPTLTVASRQIEVRIRAATVYDITNAAGGPGLTARQGDRFTGEVLNRSGTDLILHWHGQIRAANTDDRTRPVGGAQPDASTESYDFELTPGTHGLTAQTLLAAPMVTVEADATTPEATAMLHDFAFRAPTKIMAEMHPVHLHGHHFQVVDVGRGRLNRPLRDTVIVPPGAMVTVPPGAMVTVAVPFDKPGDWHLHHTTPTTWQAAT